MRSDDMTAFYQLHRDLPREGPGEAADVAWATALADLAPVARVADVACGPGATSRRCWMPRHRAM
ncbi:hypothetical protein ACFQFQ_08945 [Sulfitobacter porphyrae]|uniref:Uncharacterized protein n=1 Tax=Sulfitobacter porphyrae TaxID=1246864 RepID=A0ABW2B358_9RHOB